MNLVEEEIDAECGSDETEEFEDCGETDETEYDEDNEVETEVDGHKSDLAWGFDLSQWPRHAVERLNPVTRHMLETGRVPPRGPAMVPALVQEYETTPTLEALDVTSSTVSSPPLGTPERPWRSSARFVAEARPGIEWLIDGVLPKGAVVLLSGREGSMKSYLALSMAHAVATGSPWLGKQTKQGPALYLDGEMDTAVLSDRLRGIDPHGQVHIWTWTDGTFPDRLNGDVLQRAAKEHVLIIVDPLRRHMDGLKENSADDMSQVTKDLRELKRYGATVLVLHHAPKDTERQDYRGSTELGAGVDLTMMLTMKETAGGAVLTLNSRKTRYGTRCRLEIEAREGPVFAITESGVAEYPGHTEVDTNKQALLELARIIDELRQTKGRDPYQSEIVKEAGKRNLGARKTIIKMLEQGDGVYWHADRMTKGKVTYAPWLPVEPKG